ncbi:MAG: hypothetical protein II670_04195 [Alphaproteobacteria bacterium]|nr:hypothetical protein [Alphaproteobacteria bacterium]
MSICCVYWQGWTAIAAIATGLSAIATAVMAFIALRSLLQNKKQLDELKKQREEENCARLVFEIVSYQQIFMLKIMNVGKSTAFDVFLDIKSEVIEKHFSEYIKSIFVQNNNKRFVMAPGRCLYFYLTPIHTTQKTHKIDGVDFSSEMINQWLEKYKDEPIIITGSYCGRYEIHEKFSINDFMGTSLIVYDNTTLALQDIGKELKKINEKCK